MLNTHLRTLILSSIAVTSLSLPVLANTSPSEKGAEIAKEWDARDKGFGDSSANLEMVLENRHGEKSTRVLRIKTLEMPDSNVGDKSLTIFSKPRDIKGTAFLSFAQILEPDDQWLYLPALKRVKKISSKNKSGPFVGSEFSYEDLSAQELKKYNYKWLNDEACGELQCSVLEQTPAYENSGYTKMIVWYDTAEYRQQKIDYYDRKGALLKTLKFTEYRQYLSKFWRAHNMYMVNHQTGKKTRLVYSDYAFQTGLKGSDLTKRKLSKVR